MMTKIRSFFSIASQVMTFISMTLISLISLATAYIVFAPDIFPKPFYLVYQSSAMQNVPTGYVVANEDNPSTDVEVQPTEPAEVEPGQGIMLGMTTKIINLADTGGHKYIRLTVVLEFAPDNPEYRSLPTEEAAAYLTDFQTRAGNSMPAMDDVVITLLSTKTFEELYTAEGKEALRTEVMEAINARQNEFHVISVYFTEFVVQ